MKTLESSPVLWLCIILMLGWSNRAMNQTVVTIGTGSTTTYYNPIYISSSASSYWYSNTISLYTAAELGSSGNIVSIAWNKADAQGYSLYNATLKIYLKHTSISSVPTTSGTFAGQLTGATLVYNNTAVGLPTSAGWQEYLLTTPFIYDGTSSLMVLVDWYRPGAPTGVVNWFYTLASGMAYTWSASVTPPTIGYGSGYRPNTRLTFAPNFSFEAANLGFVSPTSGCDLGLQAVSLKIKNQGIMTIAGGITASYKKAGTTPVVTQSITDSIIPGATYTFAFTTPVNLTTTVDTAFTLISWINLTGDSLPLNDSATTVVNSAVGPPPPQVANAMVSGGQSASLSVINPDSNTTYHWFDSLVGGNELAAGDTFVTPPLLNTTTYYVEGRLGSISPVLFTEFNLGEPDAMEITNMTQNTLNLTGWKVVVNGQTYSNINTTGTVLMDLGIMQPGEVRYWTDQAGNNYWGGNLFWNPGTYPSFTGWAMIVDNTGQVADFAAWGWPESFIQGFSATINNFPVTVGNAWIGNGINNPSLNFLTRVAYDSNTASDWINQATGTMGTLNPGMVNVGGGTSNACPSIRVPATAFVQAPLLNVFVGNDTTICHGDSLHLNAVVSGGVTPYTYSWSPTNTLNNPQIPNPIIYPPINTVYSLTVTDQNSDYGTDVILITVAPPPSVMFAPLANVHINTLPFPLYGGMPAGGTYSGPGVIGTVFHPAVAGPGGHILTYTYMDPLTGCTGSATTSIFVDPTPGLNEYARQRTMVLFPNPAKGQLTVSITLPGEDMLLELLDLNGRVLMQKQVYDWTAPVAFDVRSLFPGVYLARLTGLGTSSVERLVIH